MLQRSRRAVQIIILLLIVAMPLISFYGRLLSGRGQRDLAEVALSEEGPVLGGIYVAMDKVYSPSLNAREAVEPLDGFKGGAWSLTIFGYNITDPLAGIAAMLGSRSIYVPLILSMLLPIIFILVFGRAFCAWICPMNTLFEINNWIRNKVEKYLFVMPDLHMDRRIKYSVLGVSLVLTVAGVSLLPYLLPYALVSRQPYYYVYYRTLGVGMVMILLMFLFEIFVSRRGWCRYLCPGGAFFSLLSPMRLVKVGRDASSCMTGCTRCSDSCKMGLMPHEDKTGMECDNCGLCVTNCPSDAMKYKAGAGSKNSAGGFVKVLLVVCALLLAPHSSLLPEVYAAHAKLINPHAGSSEESGEHTFPMAPSEEHSLLKDGYLISFSAFQFAEMKQRGHKVKSVVTVRDSKGVPYTGPLEMNIVEYGLFGKVQESDHTFEATVDNRFRRFDWFSREARCRVVIYFEGNSGKVTAEFPLTVGNPLPGTLFFGALGAALISIAGLIIFVNKKRKGLGPPASPAG